MIGRTAFIYGASMIVHLGVALSVAAISPPQRREPTKITIREVKRPPKPKPAEPPPEVAPPPPPEAPAVAKPKPAKKAAEPPPTAAAPAAPAAVSGAVPSFGLTLGGAANGGGGIAIAAAPAAAAPAPVTATKTAAPKALVRAKQENACLEALVKPKPLNVPQPVYPQAAREAGIAGKVRVELRVDASGKVVSARVLEGLGSGLDEAALEAARAAMFEPASLCGVPTETTFVIGMRFSL